jgi:4-amino-4-deoxy-L-arabinose transferase-like glycosyltransferase
LNQKYQDYLANLTKKILLSPRLISYTLIIWVLLLCGYGLGSLEYVRHTEADRTLIAWEMNERSNYLVPTLLGSQILTKPPLFYWITAFFLKLFNSQSELVARLSSLFSAMLFVFFSFNFLHSYTNKKRFSALCTFALSTSVMFYILAAVAEIDMIFGFLASCSLYSGFLLYEKRDKKNLGIFSIFVTFAFLAKGPPVYFFCIGAFGLLLLNDLLLSGRPFRENFDKFISILFGLIIAGLLLSIWLIPLGYEVGWSSLRGRLDEEVFRRVTEYSERDRGAFFYIEALFYTTLPWSLFGAIGLFHIFKTKWQERKWHQVIGGYLVYPEIRRLFTFNLLVVLSGFLMLSVAQGKSSRYCFTLAPFLINICVILSPLSLSKFYFRKLLIIFRIVSVIAIFFLIGIYIFGDVQGLSKLDWIISTLFIVIASLIGLFSSSRAIWKNSIFVIAFLFFMVRIVQTHLYIPHRNSSRTVQPLVASLLEESKTINSQIFTIELFERWSVYYAKRSGLNILRLSPEIVLERMKDLKGETYLLLDFEEESWRYYQAIQYSSEVKIRKIFPHISSSTFLMSVPNSILDKLGVFAPFPTHPSKPFYRELAEKGL